MSIKNISRGDIAPAVTFEPQQGNRKRGCMADMKLIAIAGTLVERLPRNRDAGNNLCYQACRSETADA
jgi:hypothetical protein